MAELTNPSNQPLPRPANAMGKSRNALKRGSGRRAEPCTHERGAIRGALKTRRATTNLHQTHECKHAKWYAYLRSDFESRSVRRNELTALRTTARDHSTHLNSHRGAGPWCTTRCNYTSNRTCRRTAVRVHHPLRWRPSRGRLNPCPLKTSWMPSPSRLQSQRARLPVKPIVQRSGQHCS